MDSGQLIRQHMDKSFKTHPRNIFGTASLVVVDVDALQLKVRLASIAARGVDAVLVAGKLGLVLRHIHILCV